MGTLYDWTLTVAVSASASGEYDDMGYYFSPDISGTASADVTILISSIDEPAATPIPGAVWLLGSGLVGLVGVRRRMKA